MGDGFYVKALIVLAFFLLFLPAIIAETKGRVVLVLAAIVLSLLSMAVLALSLGVAGTIGALALPFAAMAAGFLWIAGLFCGLAAWINSQQERRHRESMIRLMTNDARGLGDIDEFLPRRLRF